MIYIQKKLLEISYHLPLNKLRCIFYGLCGNKIGKNAYVAKNAKIKFGNNFSNDVQIEPDTFVQYTTIGNNSKIDRGAFLLGVKKNILQIGNHSYVGSYNILDGSGGLVIGNYVHISGPSVGIWTHSSILQALKGSNLDDPTYRHEGPINIESNVWIGGKTTIYPNTTIGHHSVVFPNSVVNKDVPPFSVVGGVPAKIIAKVEVNGDTIEFTPLNTD